MKEKINVIKDSLPILDKQPKWKAKVIIANAQKLGINNKGSIF